MSVPVVETKLALPRIRDVLVARPRLDHLLAKGSHVTLTLVSAPAGFGKTTLLGYLAGARAPAATAWVSLDERDRDASSFWTYVLLAVDRAAPGTAAAALGQLQSGQAPVEAVLTALLNELSVLPDDAHLVLDDYHLADGPDIQPGMTFLLDHLPPQVHLVISTRADPALPLARLRARGRARRGPRRRPAVHPRRGRRLPQRRQRASAWPPTTSPLWRSAPRDGRPPCSSPRCRCRAEPTRSRFIAGFAGDDRFVVDYLADEVLDRQPADVRTVPARHLDPRPAHRPAVRRGHRPDRREGDAGVRWTGRTCSSSRSTTTAAGTATTTCSPTSSAPACSTSGPATWPSCTVAPATGTTRPGDPEAAVRHALAAGDVDLAADLVELAIPELRRRRREAVIRRWIDDLPPTSWTNRPVLAIGFVGALAASNEFDGLERAAARRRTAARPTASTTSSSSTRPSSPGCPRRSRPTAPASRSSPATSARRSGTPIARWPAPPGDDHLTSAVRLRPRRARVLDRRGPRRAHDAATPPPPTALAAPATSPTCWAAPSRSPTSS